MAQLDCKTVSIFAYSSAREQFDVWGNDSWVQTFHSTAVSLTNKLRISLWSLFSMF